MMNLRDHKIGILGIARSGIAAAIKILDNGGTVFLSDIQSAEIVKKNCNRQQWERLRVNCEFGTHTDKVLQNDYLIVSPGIPLNIPIIQEASKRNIKIINEIELGFLIKDEASKIIAVTGSNGKSTTASLIYSILNNAGYKVILAGNIGQPLTSFPIEKPGIDYIVLELSSFQLELIDKFKADTAVLLNITPDHLDRHVTINEYIKAKFNIFKNQTEDQVAVLNADDEKILKHANSIPSKKLYFSSCTGGKDIKSIINENTAMDPHHSFCKIVYPHIFLNEDQIIIDNTKCIKLNSFQVKISVLSLLGIHNVYNSMAAILATADLDLSEKKLITTLKNFQPLEHRLEKVAEINGILFINDSKATNTESVKYALSAYKCPIHIILGGYNKSEDYSSLASYLQSSIKSVNLIGDASAAIRDSLEKPLKDMGIPIFCEFSLEDAVRKSFYRADKGDCIMLSPACASYDMFDSYEHRGKVFKKIVKQISLSVQSRI